MITRKCFSDTLYVPYLSCYTVNLMVSKDMQFCLLKLIDFEEVMGADVFCILMNLLSNLRIKYKISNLIITVQFAYENLG